MSTKDKLTINNRWNLGDLVYLVHDPEAHQRMVTAITVTFRGSITYSLQCGTEASEHFDHEITDVKPIR